MAYEANTTAAADAATLSDSPRLNWRNYVANVRGDAIELTSLEVANYMAENPGEFDTLEQALLAYRADFCFFCPVLQHWFEFEDGEETFAGWRHLDAKLIGHNDAAFQYGEVA